MGLIKVRVVHRHETRTYSTDQIHDAQTITERLKPYGRGILLQLQKHFEREDEVEIIPDPLYQLPEGGLHIPHLWREAAG